MVNNAVQLYFAPMEGITGYVFRQVHHRFFSGVDRYYMPFLSPSQHHVFTRQELRDILPEHNQGLTAVPQLLTRRGEDFLWAARELAAMGYGEVNLNLGCPSGTVAAKGKGAGFLADPQGLDRFLDEIFSAAPVAVSIKTRLGVQEAEEFQTILEIYNKYPVAQLTIHPRVQRDFYKNQPRRDVFQAALATSQNPICYNGDLVTAAQCRDFAAQYPQVQALMMGRGLVSDPALASKARGGDGADSQTLQAFHDGLYQGYARAFDSRRNAMLRMKEVWFYLIHLFADHQRYAKQLRKVSDPQGYEALTGSLFRDLALRPDSAAGFLA